MASSPCPDLNLIHYIWTRKMAAIKWAKGSSERHFRRPLISFISYCRHLLS
ncbi:hypothetical protein NEISICOT_03219 [Neisseria sicca ATCC 29256]|uniref:Uncharacterized protein n=1 Tax=Neisseria sicca ATCC 29256 TaxID=547045 RepID=C6M9E9_NEISI|nr:hypothetical protein NEISICOT_03219 [Neisseria sicca ATCC 29256]